ncbi:MAG: hypothetical protein KKF27_21645 [Gammaproteobacteria bacterium]|nr:hypothetical protein [Gammaproteobacteria bacterium]
MTKQEAIDIILSDKEHYDTSLNYAVNYCKAALDMTGHKLDVQILYILNNIQKWRHPLAKEVRAALRSKG